MKYRIIEKSQCIVLIVLFIILTSYFISEYITSEQNEYRKYNDLTRADIVMSLSYNKDRVNQFFTIRQVQSMNSDDKLSKADIVYDFSSFQMIPILNYLITKNENENLIESFEKIMDFLADYNSATIVNSENILVKQKNGKYYNYNNGIYTYQIRKNIISKKGFEKIYNEYIKTQGFKTVEDNFLTKLFEQKNINQKYSLSEIKNKLIYNYNDLYKGNETEIAEVISKDLNKFVEFLYNEYIFIDEENNDKRILLKPILTEELELNFNFTEGDRIYLSSTKYFSHLYILDINDVWEQLKEKGYPMLYS